MNPIERIAQVNQANAQQELSTKRHAQEQLNSVQLQETILKSFQALVKYLEGNISKTQVVNQLEKIGTPDVYEVVDAVSSLHETIKTHENTDLSEITSVMKQMLEETKKIPKSEIKIPEHKEKDYVAQFKSLTDAVKAVEKQVKAQKLVAEAPVVNVPAPKVNVEAPDLTPIEKGLKDVSKAVKANKTPDVVKTEQINTLINEKFDEYRITWDGLEEDDDDQKIEAITYYLNGKKVARIKYVYNSNGKLIGGKKA
jgi:antitoxin component YwqK of YwqJK toxin-antitoxin module